MLISVYLFIAQESLTAKIESMKRALEASQSSHESESEQWQAQVTALKSLVDSTISERDELRRENSSYAVRTAQMQVFFCKAIYAFISSVHYMSYGVHDYFSD
jgi:peptidoglycan hydrolase CwlO-like protein